jgi:hypothetical protein
VGGCGEVDDGFDADRVGEGDVSALEVVAGSRDEGAPFSDGDAAEQGWRGNGAAEAQVDIAGQLGEGF